MDKVRVFTAFSGTDTQCMALDRLKKKFPGFDYDLVGWSEFDPTSKQPIEKQPAVIAHNAVYPQWKDRNYGDISLIDWEKVPDFDLFTYSFPCQSISNAGLQHGLSEGSGTRSSLVWECRKVAEIKRPKIMVMENVKALVGKKFINDFNKWCEALEELGYTNFWQIMNAKDYGVPQNRERVFMVSFLDSSRIFHFPTPFPLTKCLNDLLEDEVDEKFYLKEETVRSFAEHCERKQRQGCGFKFEPTEGEGYAKSICTRNGSQQTDNFIKEKCTKEQKNP